MNTAHLDKQIVLKRKEDRRIVRGHPWAFSNEVQEIRGAPQPGDVVELLSAGGATLGVGFFNPRSLISFRRLSHTVEEIDRGFFHRKLGEALALRRRIYPDADSFRIVHGEGDFLPGLVVDKYGDQLVVQAYAFGMDVRLDLVCDVLEELLHPAGIVERDESPLRLLEGLEQKKTILRGNAAPVEIVEHGVRYAVDTLEGQKTGFFLDQRENRRAILPYAHGARVFDGFCNDGGFSLNALRGGAASVLGVDISADAVARATENARRNDGGAVRFERGDVFEELDRLAAEGSVFDLVILDPPSFTKNRKSVPAAKQGYKDLHARALRVLPAGGILCTACCSHHIAQEVFLDLVAEVGRKAGRLPQLLDWAGAALDHPVLPGVEETRYLTFAAFCMR